MSGTIIVPDNEGIPNAQLLQYCIATKGLRKNTTLTSCSLHTFTALHLRQHSSLHFNPLEPTPAVILINSTLFPDTVYSHTSDKSDFFFLKPHNQWIHLMETSVLCMREEQKLIM